MFELVKWYMDVVAEDGRAVFAYSAKLRWGAARVSVGSYCHRNIAGVLREESTFRPGREPAFEGGRLAPRLAHRIAGPLATLREHKQVASSQLLRGDRVLDHGWSLYEELA